MRTSRRVLRRGGWLVLLAVLLVGEAGARGDEKPGWEPELAVGFGAYTESLQGRAVLPTGEGGELITEPGDSLISTLFNFDLNLYTPFQLDVTTRPRLVLTTSFMVPLAEELIASRLDESFDGGQSPDPGFATNCPALIPNQGGNLVPPSTCSLALRTRVSPRALWAVGLGVDLTLPFDQDQFHLIPAFEYFGMSMQAEGEFTRRSTVSDATGTADFVELVDVVGNEDVLHGIAGSLTGKVDVYAEGPWFFSMFLRGRAAYLLTDSDLSVSTGSPLGNFTFIGRPGELALQVMAGFTIRLDPSKLD